MGQEEGPISQVWVASAPRAYTRLATSCIRDLGASRRGSGRCTKVRPRCSCSTTCVLPLSLSSTRLGDAEVRGEEHGRRLLWGRSGHRYPVVVLAVGQCSLIPRYQRPDALALLQHQREPLDLLVGHAICSLSALPSC